MSDFGPEDIGAVLQGIGSLAGAFAVGFAAWMASNTFENWRRQKISERRIEQAERILTATYKVRRGLSQVRNPMIWAHELGRVDKRDSPGAVIVIQAGICNGDQRGTKPDVERRVGVL
ncbi:hypothetical protein [Paracoccus sp. (in: a-proteobacteria)]|uniref:hypothetical protein n=1 Tax=Paracoccus sp. TaxID=267 RepID=UPI00258FD772|nr:hypothetical protein [Paracoccus sp. (in: a-proteobacteria)]